MGHFGLPPIRSHLVRRGHAGPHAQLLRAGRPADRRPVGLHQPVLRARPRLGALPDGGDRHGGSHRRVAGPDLGRVLAHAPGDAAGLLAAHDDRAHVGHRHRPDLSAAGQPDPGHACVLLVLAFQSVEQSGRGLRHRGHRNDDDHHDPLLPRGAGRLELAEMARVRGGRALPRGGSGLSGRQPGQDPEWRVVPARRGGRGLHADDHLEARARGRLPDSARQLAAHRPLPRRTSGDASRHGCRASPCS